MLQPPRYLNPTLCRSRQILGSAKDFCSNFPKLAQKVLRSLRLVLSMTSEKAFMCFTANVWCHCLKSHNVCSHLYPDIQGFCPDFQGICSDFQGFCSNVWQIKLLGYACTPVPPPSTPLPIAAINLLEVDLDKTWNYLWCRYKKAHPPGWPPFERCPIHAPALRRPCPKSLFEFHSSARMKQWSQRWKVVTIIYLHSPNSSQSSQHCIKCAFLWPPWWAYTQKIFCVICDSFEDQVQL